MSREDLRNIIRDILDQEGIRGERGARALTVSSISRPETLARSTVDGTGVGGRVTTTGASGRDVFRGDISNQLNDNDFIIFWGDFLHDITEGFATTEELINKLKEHNETTEEPEGVWRNDITKITIYNNNILSDYLGYSPSLRSGSDKLSYIVLNTNKLDPSARDEDLLSIWLRGIPTTEISKAIPYVRVSFIQPSSSRNAEGGPPRMSLDFSLNENDGKVAWGYVNNDDELFGINSGSLARQFDRNTRENIANRARGARRGVDRASVSEELSLDSTLVESYADIFHAPQTLRAKDEALDPYAPLLGLTNFSVNVTPTRGIMSYKTGKMSLVLFDRSRLGDIAPLVSPALYASTEMRIEWGWKCDLPESMHNPYTRLLNNLKITEAYGIVNSNFTFSPDNNSANIELNLFQRPQRLVDTIPIGLGALTSRGEDVVDSYNAIENTLEAINEILREIRSTDADLAANLNQSTWLGTGFSLSRALNFNSDELASVRQFVSRNSNSQNENLNALSRNLDSLIGGFDNVRRETRRIGPRNSIANTARSQERNKRINELQNELNNLRNSNKPGNIMRRENIAKLLERLRNERSNSRTGGGRETIEIQLLGGELANYTNNMANAVRGLINFIELNLSEESLLSEEYNAFSRYNELISELQNLENRDSNTRTSQERARIRVLQSELRSASRDVERAIENIEIEFNDPWIDDLIRNKPRIFTVNGESQVGLASRDVIETQFTVTQPITNAQQTRTGRSRARSNNREVNFSDSMDILNNSYTNRRGKWTSLGRVMGICVGKPLLASGKFSEIQFVWHNFNEQAGWVHNEPICNMPIYTDELKTILNDLLTDKGPNLKISDFINSLNSDIIRNPASRTWGMHEFYEEAPESGRVQLREQFRQDNSEYISERNKRLAAAYDVEDDASTTVRFRRPMLRMHIEEQPSSIGNNKNICRIHIMDSANNTWRSLGDLLAAARVTDVELPTMRDINNTDRDEVAEIVNRLSERGIINTIQRENGDRKIIVLGDLKKIKQEFYQVMPTLRYGSEGSNAISARFTTINNQALNTVNIQRTLTGRNLTPGQSGNSTLPMRISPTQVNVEMLGMPFIRFAQSMFVDFDTSTTADNIYAITGIDYTITPGDFKVSLSMIPPRDAYAQYESTTNVIDNLLTIVENSVDEPPPSDDD